MNLLDLFRKRKKAATNQPARPSFVKTKHIKIYGLRYDKKDVLIPRPYQVIGIKTRKKARVYVHDQAELGQILASFEARR